MNTSRILKLAGGALLAVVGLQQKGKTRIALTGLGGALIYAGLKEQEAPASLTSSGDIYLEDSVVVHRPLSEVYMQLRNFPNLPQVFSHLEKVEFQGENIRFKGQVPLGMLADWDIEMVFDDHQERFGWRSKPGSMLDNAGSLTFEKIDAENTRVHVALSYKLPKELLTVWKDLLTPERLRTDLEVYRRKVERV
ncbi:SRPBCC family protein [Deinococcus cellulosilyticus]|uniref:SRPBCC family protein n=1 Tax=Deinococcus cellulosilyticus TaxID=401558 RepID=UPI0011BF360E|nr:SRPBCC family protein [Deinococcus cellulosilyticus]